jgi:rRNA processing protein Krr1/Pno1
LIRQQLLRGSAEDNFEDANNVIIGEENQVVRKIFNFTNFFLTISGVTTKIIGNHCYK